MTDAAGAKYEKSILYVFGELVKQKDASLLYKGYVFQQLRDFIRLRPNSWGMQYCPALRSDVEWMDQFTSENRLRSSDWLQPPRNAKLAPKLREFFAKISDRSYLAQAVLNHELIRNAATGGLRFAGFVSADGKPILLGEADKNKEFVALDGEFRPIAVEWNNDRFVGAAPVLLSPLFSLPIERRKTLASATAKARVGLDTPGIREALPPLFKGIK